ncbi:MAG: membrane dipeptidase [Usitatibacteraceae bacterium]
MTTKDVDDNDGDDTNEIGSTAPSRRSFLQQTSAVGLSATMTSAFTSAADAATTPARKASRPLIIDALGGFSNTNLTEAETEGPTRGIDARSLADAKASGLTAVNLTIGFVAGKEEPFEHSIRDIAHWDTLLRRHAASLIKVQKVADILNARAQGKIGVIYGFQNAAMMGNDASRAEIFANLGVRIIQLTYNLRNALGDGAMVPENKGLTAFGRQVVDALNRHRVLVDLSHSGEQICLDAIAASKKPSLISHTGCRALAVLPRNKSDRELKLVADKGGFVGIYFMPFLAIDRQPMAADLIAHIEHAIKVCGEDHIGIGTDGNVTQVDDMPAFMERFRQEIAKRRAAGISATGERADIVTFLPDLTGVKKFHKLAELLAKRGHSSRRIEKILGANFMRVAGEVW